VSTASYVVDIDVISNWCLSELGSKDLGAASLIRKRDVNKGIKTTWTAKGIVELLWSIGSADDEDILLGCHSVHFCKKLVDHTI